jgi:all-trans-retinol 13,14-reductase
MAERVWTSYKQHPVDGSFDAIVVGSGLGGLTAAALLAKHGGKRVVVLERHYTAGGFTHTFRRADYEWDVGLHYVGQVHDRRSEPRRVFDHITNRALNWAPMPEVYDRIIIGDRSYDLVAGPSRLREALKGYFPQEARAIDRYFEKLRAFNRTTAFYFAERILPPLVARLAGPLLRAPFLRYSRQTTRQVLERLTQNRELLAVLTGQYGDYGLPPSQSSFAIHAMVASHYLRGACYPVGGSGRIAATIVPVIESAGGVVRVSAEVAGILVDRGRAVGVRMADGREIRAPIVVSDAGLLNTFGRLLPEDAAERAGMSAILRKARASSGHLCLYVGLRHSDAELGLQGTNLWIYPDADHDANADRYLRNLDAPLPLTYISFPSVKDPTFQERYPGRATIEVLTAAPFAPFAPWADSRWRHRGAAYNELKARFSERLLDQLYAYVPQVKGKVDYCELSTPLSTRHFANYPSGEIYGLSHDPGRFELPIRAETPIAGLYLTGQDLVTAGIAGALMGGVLTATAILGFKVFLKATRD